MFVTSFSLDRPSSHTHLQVPEPLPAPPCARVPCGDDIWARLTTRDATSFYLDFADPHGNALDPALDVYDVGKPGTMTRLTPDFPLLTNPSPQTPTSNTDPSPKRVSKRSPLREQTLRERTLSTINRPDSTYFLNKYVNSIQASTPNLPSLPCLTDADPLSESFLSTISFAQGCGGDLLRGGCA